jgi:hypothetical protein
MSGTGREVLAGVGSGRDGPDQVHSHKSMITTTSPAVPYRALPASKVEIDFSPIMTLLAR